MLWRVCLRAKRDIQDRRFRISSAALLRQFRQCFAGKGRDILNSNPVERLDEHPFILGLPAVRINGVPFSLAPSGRKVAFLHFTPSWRFYVTFSYISWFNPCQLNWNKQINKTNIMLNGLLIKYLIWINFSSYCSYLLCWINVVFLKN